MRRLARHPSTILAALSLLLFMAVCAAWARSYLPGTFHSESIRGRLFLIFSDGPIGVFDSDSPEFLGSQSMLGYIAGQTPRDRAWQGLNFALFIGEWTKVLPDSGGGALPVPFVVLIVPYWAIAAVIALLAAVAVRRARRLRRLEAQGRCLDCGYDLRASPDRCPECGTLAPVRSPAASASNR